MLTSSRQQRKEEVVFGCQFQVSADLRVVRQSLITDRSDVSLTVA